jgi:hypothetical protein
VSVGFGGGIATIYDGATCPSTQTPIHTHIFLESSKIAFQWNVCKVKRKILLVEYK